MSAAQPPLQENATRDLARFASGLAYEDLPWDVVERIKLCVLDSIGCTLFGATLPWTRKVADFAMNEGARPVASLAGMGEENVGIARGARQRHRRPRVRARRHPQGIDHPHRLSRDAGRLRVRGRAWREFRAT